MKIIVIFIENKVGGIMKRNLIVLLVLTIVMSSFGLTLIYAQTQGITIDAHTSIQNKAVTIYGTISSGSGEQVTLLVTKYGTNCITDEDIIAISQKKSGKNGKFSFYFNMPEWADYGTYIVKVGGSGISTPLKIPFSYKPNDSEQLPIVTVTDSDAVVHEYTYNTDGTSVKIGASGIVQFTNNEYLDTLVFAGWYFDKDFTVPVSNGATVVAGDTIYSKYIGLKDNLEMEDTEIRTTGTQALRFIARISKDFRSEMIALHSDNYAFDPNNEYFNSTKNIGYGLLLIPTNFLGEQPLTKDQTYRYGSGTYSPSVVPAQKTYYITDEYVLYTGALTGTTVKNYKREYSARPYITYKDASGIERTVYGPTKVSTMYDTAKRIIAENTEPEEIIEYLQTNIVDVYDAYVSGQPSSSSIEFASRTITDTPKKLDNDIQDGFEPLKDIVQQVSEQYVSTNITNDGEAIIFNPIDAVSKQTEDTDISELFGNDSSYMINRINFTDETGNEKDKPVANGKVSSVSVIQQDRVAPAGIVIVYSTQKGELKQVNSAAISESTVNVAVDNNVNLDFGSEYESLVVTAMVWENYETIRPLSSTMSEKYGSSVHVSAIENSSYIFSVNDSGVSNFNDIVYLIEFDASVLDLVDCIANTSSIESNVGMYGNITIVGIGEGFVKFKNNNLIPHGKKWSGVVNRLRFNAVNDADTYVYITKSFEGVVQ